MRPGGADPVAWGGGCEPIPRDPEGRLSVHLARHGQGLGIGFVSSATGPGAWTNGTQNANGGVLEDRPSSL